LTRIKRLDVSRPIVVAEVPIKDVLLSLVGQPRGPALVAIEKCVAVAADLGARITALVLEEEDVFERPKVMLPYDRDFVQASPGAGDMQQLLNAFSNAASRANMRAQSRSGKLPADQIGAILAEHARFSDLTLVPVKPHDSRTEAWSRPACSNRVDLFCSVPNIPRTNFGPNSKTS